MQYLEARLVHLAAEAKRAELDNGHVPQLPALSEADAADTEGFLTHMLLCLPVVGLNVSEKTKAIGPESRDLVLKGIITRGQYTAERLMVLAGSQVDKQEASSISSYLTEHRRALVARSVLK